MGANEGPEEKLNMLSQREVSELEFPSLEEREEISVSEIKTNKHKKQPNNARTLGLDGGRHSVDEGSV